MAKMTAVESRAISAVGYDPATRELKIRFTSQVRTYTYFDVPKEVYEGLMSAPSMGNFFDKVIRDHHHYR